MSDSTLIKISRAEAATAHTLAAIQLFFSGGPLASVHVLAASANDIIEAYLSDSNLSSFSYKSQILSIIKDEHRAAVWKQLRKAQGELKHADRNRDKPVSFSTEHTELLLYFAAVTANGTLDRSNPRLKGTANIERLAYMIWFKIKKSEIFFDVHSAQEIRELGAPLETEGHSKAEFYAWAKQYFQPIEDIMQQRISKWLNDPSELIQILTQAFEEQQD